VIPTGRNNSPPPGSRAALRVALVYGVVAGAWIFGSDAFLSSVLPKDAADLVSRYQTLKGLAFVVITALLLFISIRQAMKNVAASQREAARSQDRFRRLVEFSPTGIFINSQGKIVYANHALVRILGARSADELIGKAVFDLVHPDYHEFVLERLKSLRENEPVPSAEERMRRMDGSYVWVDVSAMPVELDGELAVQGIVQDISPRKQAEEALQRLNQELENRVTERTTELRQANEDLQTFSYMVSHDLRTPLRSITRFASDLLENPVVGGDLVAQEASRRIVAVAARIDRLVKNLYEYNQLTREDVKLDHVSTVLVVHDVIGQLRREPEYQQAEFTVREPMPWVLAHRPTLAIALQNLLQNAVKFVPPGVRAQVKVHAEDHGPRTRIVVEDNGIGIQVESPEALFQLFERPHRSSDSGGSGIGLAIVRRGVERMGGRVGVESIPGNGSRFWIEMPRDPSGA
jgi:PAS domain S-box-containing protein